MSAEGRATEAGSPPDLGQQPATTAVATEGRTPPHVHSEAGIFAILGQYAVMQIVWTATGIIRNKIVAFKLGPSAFGEFCQLQAVMAVAVTLVGFGMTVSVSRNVARSREPEERQEHLANANGIVLALSLAAIPPSDGGAGCGSRGRQAHSLDPRDGCSRARVDRLHGAPRSAERHARPPMAALRAAVTPRSWPPDFDRP